jgi:hypothetical protein
MDLAYVFIYICMAAFAFSLLCIICCRSPGDAHPEEEGRAAALAQLAALMERARRLAAAAPALPVVKKELGYFPYSAAEEASGQRLVCAICLEVFVHGAACRVRRGSGVQALFPPGLHWDVDGERQERLPAVQGSHSAGSGTAVRCGRDCLAVTS